MATDWSNELPNTSLRILLLSDTHNTNPSIPSAALSSTDIILHAGDLTNGGTPDEVQKQVAWLKKLSGCLCESCLVDGTTIPYKRLDGSEKMGRKGMPLIFIAGNHDLCLDASRYASHGLTAHQVSQSTQDFRAKEIREQLQSTKDCNVTYLENKSSTVQLRARETGAMTELNIFATPISPCLHGAESKWSAFAYEKGNTSPSGFLSVEEAEKVFGSIPLQTSILLSHSPPYGILDVDRHGQHSGCRLLWKHIQRVKPSLVVCGHRHEGRGCIKIIWSGSGSVKEAWRWKDPSQGSSAKLSLVSEQKAELWEPFNLLVDISNSDAGNVPDAAQNLQMQSNSQNGQETMARLSLMNGNRNGHSLTESGVVNQAELAEDAFRSTLIINAAIMGTSYQRGREKKFNKPIFVDLRLTGKRERET